MLKVALPVSGSVPVWVPVVRVVAGATIPTGPELVLLPLAVTARVPLFPPGMAMLTGPELVPLLFPFGTTGRVVLFPFVETVFTGLVTGMDTGFVTGAG
jgi:hypothetical protein